MDAIKEMLRAVEVAEWLDVRPYRVYELVRQGRIPVVRLGRQVRFSRNALEAWAAAGGTAEEDRERGA